MKFMKDNTLSGDGKNEGMNLTTTFLTLTGFDGEWTVNGTYDLDQNQVTWTKEFITGFWQGRTIEYEGRLVFKGGSISIEGTTVLKKKEEQGSQWDVIGDTGAFCLTSLCNPDFDLNCL